MTRVNHAPMKMLDRRNSIAIKQLNSPLT